MKMLKNGFAGGNNEVSAGGGRTVVVGVKLDSQSRELLTWALVKVAEPGDCVIALNVLGHNEIFNHDGKSSLLSLVKAFDAILAVYEGFCNLKQVDLKLKICRGSSIRKILVSEAKSYSAAKVIVGTARNHHTIRSSISVAKYCSKKLSKDCCVLAVNNGKIVFKKEGFPNSVSKGIEDHTRNDLPVAIHQSISMNDANPIQKVKNDEGTCQNLENVQKKKCSICAQFTGFPVSSCNQYRDEEDKALAIVPLQKVKSSSGSKSLLIREFPELKPGWPLLHCAVLSDRQSSDRSAVRRISVVQWVMRLPSRNSSPASELNYRSGQGENQSSNLNGQSGAIVPAGIENVTTPLSPDYESRSIPEELEGLHEKYSATCRLFKYQELLSATSKFSADNLIGKGGNSKVYKGSLPDGMELAVKILKWSEDVLKEFILEIDIITTLSHKNIISLLGFCFEDNNLLLVYDFLSRGSLEENLYGNNKDVRSFGWNERFKVAVGVAEALDYLHSSSVQPVIHRDVKSSNILLSDDFEPQLSDFGLAKWASTSSSHITCTDVSGTFGYMAPEYFMYGKVNDKIDVYAFGVVLLELLSGRKPISSDYPKGQESLIMWANPILNGGKLSELLDPSLCDNYKHDEMERMVLAATLCIRRSPRARPRMSIVVKLLQGDADVTKWARLQINDSGESDLLDDESYPRSNLRSHLNLALLDVDDDSLSMSSITEQSFSLEDYLQGRWSRSSSFD